MQQYVSKNRLIEAKEMTRLEYNQMRGWMVPEGENPDDKGYIVVNSTVSERNVEGFNGYVSWLPEQAFKEQYDNSLGMSFGQALEVLKNGGRVYNDSWFSEASFLFLVSGKAVEDTINDNYGDPDRKKYDGAGQPLGSTVTVFDSIYAYYPDDTMCVWAPEHVDLLSNRWFVL